jgi:rubrerythrin
MPRRKTQKRKQRKTKRNFKKRGGVGSSPNPESKRKLDASVGSPGHIRKKSRTSRQTPAVTAEGQEVDEGSARANEQEAGAVAEAAPAAAAQRHVAIKKPDPRHRYRNYRVRSPQDRSSNSIPSLTSPPSHLALVASPSTIPEERRLVAANEEVEDLEKIRQTRLLQDLNDIREQNNEKANELGMRHITVQPKNNDNPSIRVAIDEEEKKGVRYDDELRARMAAHKETEYQSRFNNTLRRNARNVAVGALAAAAAAGRGWRDNTNVTQKNYHNWDHGKNLLAAPAYMKPPYGKVITDEDDVRFWYQPYVDEGNVTFDTFLESGIHDAVAHYKNAVKEVANKEQKKMTKKKRNKRRRKATRKKKRKKRRRRAEAGRAEL